jgi:hypothetical protein
MQLIVFSYLLQIVQGNDLLFGLDHLHYNYEPHHATSQVIPKKHYFQVSKSLV